MVILPSNMYKKAVFPALMMTAPTDGHLCRIRIDCVDGKKSGEWLTQEQQHTLGRDDAEVYLKDSEDHYVISMPRRAQ